MKTVRIINHTTSTVRLIKDGMVVMTIAPAARNLKAGNTHVKNINVNISDSDDGLIMPVKCHYYHIQDFNDGNYHLVTKRYWHAAASSDGRLDNLVPIADENVVDLQLLNIWR